MKKNLLIYLIVISSMFVGCGKSQQEDTSVQLTTTSVTNQTTVTTEPEITTTTSIATTTTPIETTQITTTSAEIDELSPLNLPSYYNPDTAPDLIKNVEWTEDMIVNSDEELYEYIEKCQNEFKTEIYFILSGSCEELQEDTKLGNYNEIVGQQIQQIDLSYNNIKGIYCCYNVRYSTSKYVIDAYKTGDTSHLEGDNLEVYKKAKDFIDNTLDKNASNIEKERQIHDYICDITTYYNDENIQDDIDNIPKFRMASGAMLDGKCNCMGYSDTFYMLGTMAGFQVDKTSGTEAMNHMWNVITLDNKKYVVDVTWDDEALQYNDQFLTNYMYFNAGRDVTQEKYWYDGNNTIMQDVVQTSDENYFFAMNNPDYGYMTHSYDEFYNKIKELFESGQNEFWIVCSNNVAGDSQDMANKIDEHIDFNGSLSGMLNNMSGYSFAYIKFTPNN